MDVYSELKYLYKLSKILGVVCFDIYGQPKNRIFVYKNKNFLHITIVYILVAFLYTFAIIERTREVEDVFKLEYIPEYCAIFFYFLNYTTLFVNHLFNREEIIKFYTDLQKSVNSLNKFGVRLDYVSLKKLITVIFLSHLFYLILIINGFILYSSNLITLYLLIAEAVSMLIAIEYVLLFYLIKTSFKSINDRLECVKNNVKDLLLLHCDFFMHCKTIEKFSYVIAVRLLISCTIFVYSLFTIATESVYGDSFVLWAFDTVSWAIYNFFHVVVIISICVIANNEVRLYFIL